MTDAESDPEIPPDSQPATAPAPAPGASQPSDPSPDHSITRWTRVVARYTGWLAFFTAFLAIVAGLQFWAFVQSERGFLSVTSLTINGGFPQAGNPSVRVFFQIRNSGRTTAFPERAVLAMRVGQLSAKPEYGDEPQVALPPVPADSPANDHDVIALQRALTQDEIDAIKAGAIRMSLFGSITYSDTFGLFGKRTTRPWPMGAPG